MLDMLQKAKAASYVMMNATSGMRQAALEAIASRLDARREEIKEANARDLAYGREAGLSAAMLDRLELNDKRISAMVQGVRDIISQPDPVGQVVEGFTRPNGLQFTKVRVPLGVVGIIFESRPNVTVDAAALCLKSGNVAVLRGGKEAIHSNILLGDIMREAIASCGIPEDAVCVIRQTDRELIRDLVRAKQYLDIVIPRGGEALISYVSEHSLVPVVKHDKGLCHTYIDASADADMALGIVMNAKVQRPGVCNAMETLLVHRDAAERVLPVIYSELVGAGVQVRGCAEVRKFVPADLATDEDWDTEYLDLILSIRVVADIQQAIEHINRHGSQHSEAIITKDYANSEKFLAEVDAAAVYVNASTRFTDGGEFGLGAEIGISTQKLHCRGPMGAFDLTTTKYLIRGNGQIR